MNTKRKKGTLALLIFCLALLFNPGVNLLDPLPDFIAWFILERLLRKPADMSPYFEETRVACFRLGFLNLSKILALMLVALVRSIDTSDTDIMALASLSYAVVELCLLFSFVRNGFDALFYLGERSDATSLILPFKIGRKRTMSPEALKSFCYFFTVCKCAFYALPDLFLLTRLDEHGNRLPISRFYVYALLSSIVLGLIIGIIWIKRTKAYAKAVFNEGRFNEALISLSVSDLSASYVTKSKIRTIKSALNWLTLAAFFTLELVFDDFGGINLLPHFIYGAIITYSAYKITKLSRRSLPLIISGAVYTAVSLVTYVLKFNFLEKYEYFDIVIDPKAVEAYMPISIFAVLEFVTLAVFLVLFALSFNKFILLNTGLSPESERYGITEKLYHGSLKKGSYGLFLVGLVAGLAKMINVFLNREVQLIYSDITDVSMPTFTGSLIPWFNLVITATAILYIGYSLYYLSTVKEEVELKLVSQTEETR